MIGGAALLPENAARPDLQRGSQMLSRSDWLRNYPSVAQLIQPIETHADVRKKSTSSSLRLQVEIASMIALQAIRRILQIIQPLSYIPVCQAPLFF